MKKIFITAFTFIVSTCLAQFTDVLQIPSSHFKASIKNEYTTVENQLSSTYTDKIGAPQLPTYQKSYALPAGSIVSNISYVNSGKTLLGNNYYLYPSQPACMLNGKPCPDFVAPDAAIYNSATPYPREIGTVSSDASFFGYHIVKLNICPFEYIPSARQLYYFNQVIINIQYNIGAIEYTARITENRAKIINDFARGIVDNPSAISTSYKLANQVYVYANNTDKLNIPWKPSSVGGIPDYIIITNNDLKPSFETLANYKTKRGIATLLVTVEQIYANYTGVDNQEKIRNYLKDAYQYWGAGLFVLLGGDTAIVPARITNQYALNVSDLYYCDVFKTGVLNYNWNSSGDSIFYYNDSNMDLSPDNFIGRAPTHNLNESNTFVNKIISYENLSNVIDKSYVNNMLFLGSYYRYNHDTNIGIGADDASPNTCYGGQQWHYKLANKPFLANISLKKWLVFDDFLGNTYQDYPGNEELSKLNVLNRINNGQSNIGKFHLVSHYDHGSPFSVGTSSGMKGNNIDKSDMDLLTNATNGGGYQIMYSTACDDGEFDKDCFAEHFVNATNGGGVAMIANSGTVSVGGEEQTNFLFNSIYGNLTSTSHILGIAFANARHAVDEQYRKLMLTLFGEPTMATWSATPLNIVLTVAPSITINNTAANYLPVTINPLINDAKVTVYKFNNVTNSIEIYASQVILAGATSTIFTLNPDTPGIMTVTVTAKNYLPATANVNIIMPQAHLYVSGVTFADANGNGLIEQGETVNLTVSLTNSGGADITAINTILTTTNVAYANVIAGNVAYTQINAGQTVQLTGYSFIAQVANGTVVFPDLMEFWLNITAAGNYAHLDNFYLDLKNPKLTLGARTVLSGTTVVTNYQNNFEYDLNISIKNTGNVATGALSAILSTTNSTITIGQSTSLYNNLAIFAEGSNISTFKFKLPVGFNAVTIPFTLTLTNALGKSWSFNFNLKEPLPPLITNFRFTSTKDEIKVMWDPINNMQGYNVYSSTDILGPYTKKNTLLLTGSSFFNDAQLPVGSVFYYKIGVVTLSGNERQLVDLVTNATPALQGYKAWTSLSYHTDFPRAVSSGLADVISSTTVCDVDNNGTKEIFYNSINDQLDKGQTYGFKESSQEMYDIDGNPTTVSGFNNTNIGFWANSAVGDVDNDGHAEVFSVGRLNIPNQGKLFALKTTDANGDNKPDKFWTDEIIDFGLRVGQNPVLYDIDNNGFLDIIVADEHQKIWVYDKDKNLLPGWPQQIGDGSFIYDYSYGNIAVADLDHDGKGEIVIGLKSVNSQKNGGIYIFRYDGTAFTTNPFKTFNVGERPDSAIVLADINNDVSLDLIVITRTPATGMANLYAFKQDGTFVNNLFNGSFSFQNSTNSDHVTGAIAVGDLNNDGILEIVFGNINKLYALNINGSLPNFPKTISDIQDRAVALADIDGDPDIEILINNNTILEAYNPDGTACTSFPITGPDGQPFAASPSVADLDNNGFNEIIISTQRATICAYDTPGSASRIEWGSYRANPHNTGTYKEVCNLDLMVQDRPDDQGTEPNNISTYFWYSDSIWVRNNNDNGTTHQNPEYTSSNNPNFIKVKVKNKSCIASTGNEQISLNWAKASTGMGAFSPWAGGVFYNGNGAPMGGLVGTLNIPILQPGQEIVLTFPWIAPNPADYGSIDQWHFCLLTKIQAASDPLAFVETYDLNENVKNNNNMAWKNVTVVDVIPNNVLSPGGVVAIQNPVDYPKTYYLELAVEDLETGKPIYDEAEISIKMDDKLYNAWVRGGKNAQLLDSTIEDKRKIVTGNHVILDNIAFNANEMGTLRLNFNFLTKELTSKTNYVYHVIQKDKATNKVVGGETFVINKNPRTPFTADAGDDKLVDANQTISINAVEINEPAIYNWYDHNGTLIFQGKNLQITNAVAEKYKLEVVSSIDGFKDYSEVEVKLKPNRLETIYPNPTQSEMNIKYKLNQASSAYLMVMSYYVSTSVLHNYILDLNTSQTTLNLSDYPNGFYKLALVVNGQIVDVKIINKF